MRWSEEEVEKDISMLSRKTGRDRLDQKPRGVFHFDGLLLVFLVVGWLLIFVSATLGLQREPQHWLPVKLVPPVSADYRADTTQAPRLAPVRPQIVEAVKQDARVARPTTTAVAIAEVTPASRPLLLFRPIPTPTPTPTRRPLASTLMVSAGGPYIAKEGSRVSLRATLVSSTPETISYRWDLDNDGLYDDAEGISVTVIFYDEGEYAVGIQATDPAGQVAEDATRVLVSNVAPMVNAGKDRNASEGKEISFSATVSDPGHDVLLYYWDFGDGAGATGTLRPRHTYLDDGEYLVRLRAEDNDGGVTEASFITRVANLPPAVNAGPDRVIGEGDSVTFSGVASDPGVFDTLTYAWDLDYDGISFIPDAIGPNASAIYTDGPATIVAALRVRDKDGGQAIDTVSVAVGNVAPAILSVGNNGPVGEGAPLTLVVDATDVGSDTLSYDYDWDNDRDFDAISQPASVSHTWYDEGSYNVRIRVQDGDGGQAFTVTTVSAYNVAPSAVAGPAVVNLEGSPVGFDGSGSTDPGIYDALTYQWNFGDGSPVVTGTTVTHSYIDNRVYTATLTVRDEDGAADTDTVAVTIMNVNPVADAGPDLALDEGAQIAFAGSASDAGAGDVLTFAWDLDGDGIFEAQGRSVTFSAIELDGPAHYVVALRVRDDDYPYPAGGGGQIGESVDTLGITVNNLPPSSVEAYGPYFGHPGRSVTLAGAAEDVPADTDILTYEWDVDGDGTYELTGQTVVTAWNTAGVYTVALRVTDDDGGSGLDGAVVTIGNRLPTAEAGGPYPGSEGVPIQLSGSGSDLDGDVLAYSWDVDYDGVFETPGQIVSYTWPDNGVYTVALQVDDGWGGVVTDTARVEVANVAPTVDAGGPYTATVGITMTLTGSGTDVLSDTLTYAWDLDNNGTFEVSGQIISHTWTATGSYIVVLQVDDGDGGVTTNATTVDVSVLVPFAWLNVSYFLVRRKRAASLRREATRSGGHQARTDYLT